LIYREPKTKNRRDACFLFLAPYFGRNPNFFQGKSASGFGRLTTRRARGGLQQHLTRGARINANLSAPRARSFQSRSQNQNFPILKKRRGCRGGCKKLKGNFGFACDASKFD